MAFLLLLLLLLLLWFVEWRNGVPQRSVVERRTANGGVECSVSAAAAAALHASRLPAEIFCEQGPARRDRDQDAFKFTP